MRQDPIYLSTASERGYHINVQHLQDDSTTKVAFGLGTMAMLQHLPPSVSDQLFALLPSR